MQKIQSLLEESALTLLGPDAFRVSKSRAVPKHEHNRRGVIGKGRRRLTDELNTDITDQHNSTDHLRRVENTRRLVNALSKDSLLTLDASLKEALSRLEQLLNSNATETASLPSIETQSLKREFDERPVRGRGRPQGSVSKSNTSVSSPTTAKKTNVNANPTTTSKTPTTEKLITIGARYGYPAPPPLSTYNGKFGRSVYSSPYNPSAPILPNSQVAYAKGGPGGADEWILCRVLRVLSETRFEIQDPEPDAAHPQGQVFRATSREVLLVPLQLPEASALDRLKPYKTGSKVLAQYPETTTFYRAEVIETRGNTCMLRFEGEDDVDKLTPVERVFVLPYPER
ncbi:hypothetical protein CANINC_000831 [Pichia inconspicua]|uniref:SGF29 C-terminal domain-containing protein n=1 Tax=Pichia inconspicua TaxID=52247 RepID=A0A4T0X541_9ASCO|nr:hypothetical protein CANINC_000831 [[Candida] inconspicua]